MQTTSFTAGTPEEQAAAAEIDRHRKLAMALQSQAMQPIETPPVQPGQFAVRISPYQGLAKIAQGLAAWNQNRRADAQEKTEVTAQGNRRTADLKLLTDALQGRKAQPGGLVEDASGNVTQADPLPAQTPQERLAQSLGMIKDPKLQEFALGQLNEYNKPRVLKPGEQVVGPSGVVSQGALEKPAAPAPEGPYTLSPGAQRRGPNGEIIAENPRSQNATPYFSPQQTPNGIFAFDARTGQMKQITDKDGKPIVGAANDPELQRRLAAAKAGGHEVGKEAAVAQMDLPRVTANANNAIQLVDQMIGSEDKKVPEHPGFQTSVGIGLGNATKLVPGSNAANFHALYDQVKGGAFLSAYESLKGGGSITEIEGKKATEAITRMRTTQSEAEFVKAAREYQAILRRGVERAQQKAGAQPGQPLPAPKTGSPREVDY